MWRENNWSTVHFHDESKFNLFESNRKHYAQCQAGESLKVCKEVSETWRRMCVQKLFTMILESCMVDNLIGVSFLWFCDKYASDSQ